MTPESAGALTNLSTLVDPKVGIIRSVELLHVSERDPDVFVAYSEPCDTLPLTGLRAANRGAAWSPVRERAVIRACGESVERYCSAFLQMDEFPVATPAALAGAHHRYVATGDVYPFSEAQYSEPGFPYGPVRAETSIRWARGTSTATEQEVWVPASCVYVPYLFDVAVEPFTHMPISTGLAAGPSPDFCVRKGVLEILERDALMVAWHNRLSLPRLDPETCVGLSPAIDQLLRAGAPGTSRWYLTVLTLDVDVPIIGAALIDDADPPLTSFGISADPDPARALLLALEEAALTRVLVNRSPELDDPATLATRPLTTLRDHLLAHASSSRLRESLRFLTDDGPLLSFAEMQRRAQPESHLGLLPRLWEAGFDPIWVDVTTEDVRECGISVVRTIIAGMQPLDSDHRYRHLGGRRLFSVPVALGRPAPNLDTLNPDPHPFP